MAEKKQTQNVNRGHENTWGANRVVKAEWTDRNADSVRDEIERENEKREAANG